MNTTAKRPWMLVTIFLAGAISGAAGTTGFLWKQLPPPGMPKGSQIIERVLADLRSEVHITAEQEKQLAPILEKHGAELDAIRDETLSRVLASIEAKNAAVEKVLSPEQRVHFEAQEQKRLQVFAKEIHPPKPPQ
ncbi:MAG: hypothetical protein P4L99_18285 [Chthoniobacter sp.]|nr:hypothetical protein [Chthoniobacter sp.]